MRNTDSQEPAAVQQVNHEMKVLTSNFFPDSSLRVRSLTLVQPLARKGFIKALYGNPCPVAGCLPTECRGRDVTNGWQQPEICKALHQSQRRLYSRLHEITRVGPLSVASQPFTSDLLSTTPS